MSKSDDQLLLKSVRSMVSGSNDRFRLVSRDVGRGLIAAVTANLLLLVMVMTPGAREASVPVVNISLPLPIAVVLFWLGSFGLGFSAAYHYYQAKQTTRWIVNSLRELTVDQQKEVAECFVDLKPNFSLLLRPPGFLLYMFVYPMHVLPAALSYYLFFCWGGAECAKYMFYVFAVFGGLLTTTPYAYVAMQILINWAHSKVSRDQN